MSRHFRNQLANDLATDLQKLDEALHAGKISSALVVSCFDAAIQRCTKALGIETQRARKRESQSVSFVDSAMKHISLARGCISKDRIFDLRNHLLDAEETAFRKTELKMTESATAPEKDDGGASASESVEDNLEFTLKSKTKAQLTEIADALLLTIPPEVRKKPDLVKFLLANAPAAREA